MKNVFLFLTNIDINSGVVLKYGGVGGDIGLS